MMERQINILIPGNFENNHFSKEQEKYFLLLVKACDANVNLLHIGNPDSLPNSENQISFIRAYNSLEKKIEVNINVLYGRLKKQGLKVNYTILGFGNVKNEVKEQIQLIAPDFIILKSMSQTDYRHLIKLSPVLFLPEICPSKLPDRIAVIASYKNLMSVEKLDFFLQLVRNITGKLSILRIHENGSSSENGLQKELNHVNQSYGINIDLINEKSSPSLNNIHELITKNHMDLPMIVNEKESVFKKLLPGNSMKKLLKKAEYPLFVCNGVGK